MKYIYDHLYTRKPGDVWCLWHGYLVINNPSSGEAFTIDLETAEQEEIVTEGLCSNCEEEAGE